MNVYLPDGYNQNTYYPTFYLMHGGGQRYYTWANPVDGNAKAILDAAISSGKAVPMVVVMPDAPDFAPDLFTRELCDDIIPFVEQTYSVKKDKDSRALAGLSWGGLQVLDAGLYRYDLFGYLGVFSSGWFIGDNVYNVMRNYLASNGAKIEASMRYLYFGQGGTGDIAYNNGMETMKVLREYGITVNYWEHSGAHSFVCWRQDLEDFAPLLFKHGTPSVSITAPDNNASYTAPASFTISAVASDPDGTITKVEFFNGATKLGEVSGAPYSFTWTNVPVGTYSITAVATDNSGTQATSDAVIVKVNVPQAAYNNKPHTIPGTVQAEEFDVGGNGFAYFDKTPGSETGVSFRNDEDVDIEICTDEGGGYNIGWATSGEWLEYTVDVQYPGVYSMDLRVACNGDGRKLSVSIDGVDIASHISIPNTAGWQNWQTISVRDIPLTAGQKIMRLTIGDVDYINLNYVAFTISNIPPKVAIISPSDNSIVEEHQNVTLSVSASDDDGAITKVEFYSGNTLLGTDNASPYSYDWSGMPAGTYTITAVATDDKGAVTVSDPVTIVIREIVTGVLNRMDLTLSVYPNPFKDETILNLHQEFSYEIYDQTGRLMDAGTGQGHRAIGKKLPRGMYFLRLTHNGKSGVVKIHKEW
jgi:enterochelin esterase-like enzyme